MPELTDKEQFNEAAKFLQLPRCINCEHYQTGGNEASCAKLGQPIPLMYLYTPNECDSYEPGCPF